RVAPAVPRVPTVLPRTSIHAASRAWRAPTGWRSVFLRIGCGFADDAVLRTSEDGPMDTSSLRNERPPGHAALRTGRAAIRPGQAWHLSFTTHQREPLFEDFEAARVVSAC